MPSFNGAVDLFREDKTGSIAVGKKADLAIISNNIFDHRLEAFLETEVAITMIGGLVVHRSDL